MKAYRIQKARLELASEIETHIFERSKLRVSLKVTGCAFQGLLEIRFLMSIEAVVRGTSPPLKIDTQGELKPELVGPSQHPITRFNPDTGTPLV